jgi:hypothetical protein
LVSTRTRRRSRTPALFALTSDNLWNLRRLVTGLPCIELLLHSVLDFLTEVELSLLHRQRHNAYAAIDVAGCLSSVVANSHGLLPLPVRRWQHSDLFKPTGCSAFKTELEIDNTSATTCSYLPSIPTTEHIQHCQLERPKPGEQRCDRSRWERPELHGRCDHWGQQRGVPLASRLGGE